MMRYQFHYPAEENTIFAKDAFKNSVGKSFKMGVEGTDISDESKLIDAEVSEDGKSVLFTIESKNADINKLITSNLGPGLYKSIEVEP